MHCCDYYENTKLRQDTSNKQKIETNNAKSTTVYAKQIRAHMNQFKDKTISQINKNKKITSKIMIRNQKKDVDKQKLVKINNNNMRSKN